MFLIVWFHTVYIRTPFYLPVHGDFVVPLFFALSGLFFRTYGYWRLFLRHKVNTLIVPLMFFYLSAYVLFYAGEWLAPELIKTPARGILDIFNNDRWFNGPIWFLLALFWQEVAFFVLHTRLRHVWMCALSVLAIGLAGRALQQYEVFVPFKLGYAAMGLPFFYLGYLLRHRTAVLTAPRTFATGLGCFVCYGLFVFLNYTFTCSATGATGFSLFPNTALYFVRGTAVVLFFMLLCKSIGTVRPITYFGRYSLVPLCLHHLIYRPTSVALAHLGNYGG